MREEKGITLISLIIYIILLIVVVGILSTISQHFYSNTSYITDMGKYASEFNKFNMYFIEDIKNNSNIYSIDANKIVFEDGTIYTYSNQAIYRNKVEICSNIYSCIFSNKEEIDENNFTKKIINVKLIIKGAKLFESENDYVLKYW